MYLSGVAMFHKCVTLTYGDVRFPVMQIEFDPDSIRFAKYQAEQKTRHTSSADQNGDIRNPNLKFCKQFSGCLSEIAVEYFLNLIAAKELKNGRFVRVVRYDDIRTDGYSSAENEFDIRILFPKLGSKLDIGVRSSISYKEDISSGVSRLNIIGPYTNRVKLTEASSDYYVQPIFQLKIPNPSVKIQELDFCSLFHNGLVDLYIVGGCNNEVMSRSIKIQSLGQPDTKYRLVSIRDGCDFKTLALQIQDSIQFWFAEHTVPEAGASS
jgi:hypothetical protein